MSHALRAACLHRYVSVVAGRADTVTLDRLLPFADRPTLRSCAAAAL